MLQARERLQQQAEAQFAKSSRTDGGDRTFLDVSTIRQILVMRDEMGMEGKDIEKNLGLKGGLVKTLGRKGVVADVRVGKVTAEDSGIYG